MKYATLTADDHFCCCARDLYKDSNRSISSAEIWAFSEYSPKHFCRPS